MGVRIADLKERVRPIAKELVECGFTMTDLLSIGLLFLEGKTPNEISELRKIVNQPIGEINQIDAGELSDIIHKTLNLRAAVKEIVKKATQKNNSTPVIKILSQKDKILLQSIRDALGPDEPKKKAKEA